MDLLRGVLTLTELGISHLCLLLLLVCHRFLPQAVSVTELIASFGWDSDDTLSQQGTDILFSLLRLHACLGAFLGRGQIRLGNQRFAALPLGFVQVFLSGSGKCFETRSAILCKRVRGHGTLTHGCVLFFVLLLCVCCVSSRRWRVCVGLPRQHRGVDQG